MIDIIALFFLCKKNGQLAVQKGLAAGKWKLYTVLAWISAESVGLIFGFQLFGEGKIENLTDINAFEKNNLFGLESIALISAFGGYLIVKSILEKKPDLFDDDIKKIGVNDLKPPRKD